MSNQCNNNINTINIYEQTKRAIIFQRTAKKEGLLLKALGLAKKNFPLLAHRFRLILHDLIEKSAGIVNYSCTFVIEDHTKTA